jgi:polar amino acid transport system substrate-binding protein
MKTFKRVVFTASCAASMLAAPLQAKEVKMLFSLALPPYVINEAGKGASGFEFEIIEAALAAKGHTVKPVFVAMGAIPKMLGAKQADAAQRGSPELVDGYHYADDASVLYQDVAISLKKNQVAINSVADLKDKSIIAFQGASHFLGPQFSAAVKGNSKYAETSDERRRVMQLYASGAQAYVGDINVFKFYKAAVTGLDTSQEIVVHKVFSNNDQTINHAVFRDKQIRDDFNSGLKQLKASGQYKQIIEKYIKE